MIDVRGIIHSIIDEIHIANINICFKILQDIIEK